MEVQMPKCERCGTEYDEGKPHKHKEKFYVHEGKVLCGSCLIDMSVPLDDAEDYETYIKLYTDFHRGGLNI